MALIKYTNIINSFVSQEGFGGAYTNYVYYSVLVVYTDGTRKIVEGRASDVAPLLIFLRTPVDELQDIKQLIDENMKYVLDTICPIPDVRGMKEEEAIERIKAYDLVPNITQNDIVSDNQGTVGRLQRSRSNYKYVDIGITHDIPAVDGLTKDVAIEVLEKAGFQANINYVPSLEQEQDIVLDYSRSDSMSPVVELKVGEISKEEKKRIEDQQRREEELNRLKEQLQLDEEQARAEQQRLEEERAREEEQRKKKEELLNRIDLNGKDKFICLSCGTTSSGWYQKCPHCGAVGKIEKSTIDLIKKKMLW